ncbi:hypothetical protein [Geoalkalibacter subterraneus]|jgi:tetratricopeptide (TPR) repeat protein|uniref:Tetratricopeptide repeat protein n=1 Tax=Geoalkalibacter subterraneus TaxID=483547 RepID=A0A0B5FC17_9BACT|nr:hypothetical protein [Geoalkalibacter subterraneus]AJF05722.1 hypothetical protein GSUB_02855 [Geoalkalibacter subterraneus]
MFRSIAIVIFLLALCACQDSAQGPAPVPVAVPADAEKRQAQIVQDSSVHRVEHPAEALPIWRTHVAQRPTLVLFSQDPFLLPIPEELEREALELIRSGPPENIADHAAPGRPDPLFFPSMSVRLALQAGFFRELIWVIPSAHDPDQLDLATLRQQLTEAGILSESEGHSLHAASEGFAGTAGGVPFRIVHPEQLPGLEGLVITHFDLSFFGELYRNEVKTPIHDLGREMLVQVRDKSWETLATTLTAGNRSGRVPLDLRFLVERLRFWLDNPAQLDAPLPAPWREQAQALYLATFLETERVAEKLTKLCEEHPNEAAFHFARYRALRAVKQGNQALAALERSVSLDSVYALEYLPLATTARDAGRLEKALQMQELAEKALPNDPLIRMRRIGLLFELEQIAPLRDLAQDLARLPWSDIYYPETEEQLSRISTLTENDLKSFVFQE